MGNEFPATAKEVELSFQFKALSRPCLYKVSTDVLTWIKFHDLHFTAELNSRGFIQDQAQANYLAGLTNGKKFFLMKKCSSKSVTRLWKPFALLLKMSMIPLQAKTIRNHLVHVDRRSKTPGQWESADTKCKSKSKHIFIFIFNDFSRVKEWWCLKQQWHTFKVFKSCHQGCVTWKITHNLFWGKGTR